MENSKKTNNGCVSRQCDYIYIGQRAHFNQVIVAYLDKTDKLGEC